MSHLQFEALLTAARTSANPNDFALVTMLGLLGLRIFEACGANITDLGEEHGHRVLRVRGKGGKVVLVTTMLDAGVSLPLSVFEAWFVSAAHDDTAVERIAAALPYAARAAARAQPQS